MAGGEDWLMRPVLAGMCRYESLRDRSGLVRLFDIARMNEALDVQSENEYRAREAAGHGK